MPAAPLVAEDIGSAAFKAGADATYARWRDVAPVVRVRLSGLALGATEAFLATRHVDVAGLLKDPRLAKDAANAGLALRGPPRFLAPLSRNMLALDDPDHARLRRLVQAAFTPRRVAMMTERTEAISARLIDRLPRGRSFDLIDDYAFPLPVAVISDLLGIPDADRLRFAAWSSALIRGPTSRLAMVKALPRIVAFMRYLRRFIAAKRREPGDDLASDLVRAEGEDGRLDEEELMAMVGILVSAGHETTTSLIGRGMLALLDHPQAAAHLRANPGSLASGVEELLRFAGPIATSTPRYAREEIELAGATIPRGSLVLGAIASANRDAAVFAEPDRLDVQRTPNRHLTFGDGGHTCVGAALARMEARVAFRDLLERLPDLRLSKGRASVVFSPGPVLSGLAAFPAMA